MRLKLIKWLIIPFFAFLLMSHNTFALDLSRDVQLQGNRTYTFGVAADPSAYSLIDSNKCIRATGITGIKQLSLFLNDGLSVQAGDFLEIWFMIGINAENNASDTMIRGLSITNTALDLMEVNYEQVNTSNGVVKIILRANSNTTFGTLYISAQNPFIVLYNNEYVYAGTITNWRPLIQASNQDIINAINNNSHDYSSKLNEISNKISQQQQAEQDAVDNISDQTPTGVGQSGGSGENSQTTSLLATLGSFLTAITNLQATNCNVVLAFPQFAGGSQTVNICQNKEYTGNIVSIAGSVILVMFYLPVAFMLVSKIYSEIRSFTNG